MRASSSSAGRSSRAASSDELAGAQVEVAGRGHGPLGDDEVDVGVHDPVGRRRPFEQGGAAAHDEEAVLRFEDQLAAIAATLGVHAEPIGRHCRWLSDSMAES